jgi:hypothetical protein
MSTKPPKATLSEEAKQALLNVLTTGDPHQIQDAVRRMTGAPAPANPALPDTPVERLVAACYENDVPGMAAALKAGADINAQNGFGRTALTVACYKACPETIRLLVKAGADPNQGDGRESTPFKELAIAQKRSLEHVDEALAALLEHPQASAEFAVLNGIELDLEAIERVRQQARPRAATPCP